MSHYPDVSRYPDELHHPESSHKRGKKETKMLIF